MLCSKNLARFFQDLTPLVCNLTLHRVSQARTRCKVAPNVNTFSCWASIRQLTKTTRLPPHMTSGLQNQPIIKENLLYKVAEKIGLLFRLVDSSK